MSTTDEDEEGVGRSNLASTRSPDGYPALHFAVGIDYREIVTALLKAGCNVDLLNQSESTGNKNGTALHSAGWPSLLQAGCVAQETSERTFNKFERSTSRHVNSKFLVLTHPA